MWAQLHEKNKDLKDLYMVVHDKKNLRSIRVEDILLRVVSKSDSQ
jgi:hypothetical protein